MSDQGFYGETICAIGVFDGMHQGHQYLIHEAEQQALELGLPLLIVTFDRDPDELFAPGHAHRKLLSDQERLERLRRSDSSQKRAVSAGFSSSQPTCVEHIVLSLPFEHALADLSPEDFLNKVLAAHCTPRGIHVGADFRFGAKAAGNVDVLREWSKTHGAETFGHRLLDDGDLPVTATRIRNNLEATDLAAANRLLTRPHHLRGRIVKGRGFGREMGFPTANIAVLDGVMQPADGVYAGFFEVGSELLAAAISVGVPLTFEGLDATLEVYVLDFDDDLYEKEANIYFIEYLRPMIAFPEVSALMEQIGRDVEHTRQIAVETKPQFN
ncbi:MAG: riboflavin biosynthesis protein RibF [Coriobacteriales bacterium]|jgi:riboflavin kinase/FMN adenylyltransferase|nr:riboflavin biosynthesis protein RibF [Coriobacteriales bacterium]